ncbi:MAG TPA: class II glutamine amidotransferase [Steroidobacteraceae bacterium]|jgi:glutamate synthase domain-containing protein 1|nr:class II glutamine amidotransferase [Steroidobacteraceae bacterium]
MCGIVGLLLKEKSLRPRLGEFMVPMLIGMTERGPDSSGMAVFTDPVALPNRKLSVYCAQPGFDWRQMQEALSALIGNADFEINENHCIITVGADPAMVREWLAQEYPAVRVLSVGRSIDLYKDIGLPSEVADRYGFSRFSGTHLVGHTRMATESAVTLENAHPYTAGEDWCLVHNGSLANPGSLRRKLEKLGERFESDCDTEAACRYLHWRLTSGDSLEVALEHAFRDFDGFFTFLMGTRDKLALVRDPFACKPAIVAETDEYVAIASEFRSFAGLPGIKHAAVFEPKPAEVYAWSVQ